MVEGDRFSCNGSGREYRISRCFTCDSSGIVYLLGCKVCGKQYVGSTFTTFTARFNNYKSASHRFDKGESGTQEELFRHFTEADHHGFMEGISLQVIDRIFGDSRQREGFCQFKLDSFVPELLDVRFID